MVFVPVELKADGTELERLIEESHLCWVRGSIATCTHVTRRNGTRVRPWIDLLGWINGRPYDLGRRFSCVVTKFKAI